MCLQFKQLSECVRSCRHSGHLLPQLSKCDMMGTIPRSAADYRVEIRRCGRCRRAPCQRAEAERN